MKKNADDLKLLFFCIFSLLFVFKCVPVKTFLPFNDFPNQYHYAAISRAISIPVKIVAVAVDDYSLNKVSLQWPWKRSVYAQIIKTLDNEAVKVIGFDRVLKGASEDPQDEQILVDALQKTRCKVVLGYDFDFKDFSPGLPSPDIMAANTAVGMLNTLLDDDRVIRRMRVKYSVASKDYYSISVVMAALALGRNPPEVVAMLPTAMDQPVNGRDRSFREHMNIKDYYFYINYKVKPFERNYPVSFVSFYDVLNNMEKIKKEWGEDFLKDSLVLVYPTTEITHDVHLTPLGKMPGGFTHLNGIINILSDSSVKSPGYIPALFILISAVVLLFTLRSGSSYISLLALLAVFVFNVLGALVLWHFNIKTDFVRVIVFSWLFSGLAGAYRYFEFLARLNAIKDRATLDPLRGLYTIVYFQYRLELEARHRKVYVIMAHFENLKENTEDMSIQRLRNLWGMIHLAIAKMHGCWATYSADEVVGLSFGDRSHVETFLQPLKATLEEIFASNDLKIVVKAAAVQFKKEWPVLELFASLSHKVRSLAAGALIIQDFQIPQWAQPSASGQSGEHLQLLDGLAENIEEKNRQLLALYEKLKIEHGKTKEAFYQIITSLVNALEARDPYTQGHSQRVADYALALADELGWSQQQKERLRKASLLHDLGKIGIPDAILHKKGQLTEEEFGFIKQHEIFAVNILKPLKEIEDILPWILYHHEKWDGTGYPHGLGADAIPVASQIIAIADVYDALTTGRDYKAAVSRVDSIAIILKSKGTHFNPQLADIFVSIVSRPHV